MSFSPRGNHPRALFEATQECLKCDSYGGLQLVVCLIKLKIIILELYWIWGEHIDHNIIIYVIIIVMDTL